MKKYCRFAVMLIALTVLVAVLGSAAIATVVIRVTTDGNNNNDGSAWDNDHAMQTVQAAVNRAGATEVWVKQGTYTENISVESNVSLYGGFAGDETSWGQRDPSVHVTILDGNQSGSVIVVSANVTIDGFTIQNGSGYQNGNVTQGGGVLCWANATISNNIITDNTSDYGGAVCCSANPTISHNVITTNSADYGGAIYCSIGGTIENNSISYDNVLEQNGYSGEIHCARGSTVTISGNTFVSYYTAVFVPQHSGESYARVDLTVEDNDFTWGGIRVYDCLAHIHRNRMKDAYACLPGAVYCIDSFGDISDNLITGGGGVKVHGNSQYEEYGCGFTVQRNVIRDCYSCGIEISGAYHSVINNLVAGNDGGIACYGFYAISICNNTVVGSRLGYVTSGIALMQSGPVVTNNIVAFNKHGIWIWDENDLTSTFSNNCVFGNIPAEVAQPHDYCQGTSNHRVWDYPRTGQNGNISVDPLFLRKDGNWDCHLRSTSPCIDAGANGITTDVENLSRPVDGDGNSSEVCDIGAYEYRYAPSTGPLLGAARLTTDQLGTDIDLEGFWATGLTVTQVSDNFFYIEEYDYSNGIRVLKSNARDVVHVGDNVHIENGELSTVNGERVITGSNLSVTVLSNRNLLPELGMRCRDVGGHGLDTNNPGITSSPRGPFNVGLYVAVEGWVTYCDSTGQTPYFYIWDGTNMRRTGEDTAPLRDGNLAESKGVRIRHTGLTDMSVGLWGDLHKCKEFVTVRGVVSVDATAVSGETIPVIIPTSITIEEEYGTLHSISSPSGQALNWTELYGGTNLFSIPGVPGYTGNGDDPDTTSALWPWDPKVVLDGSYDHDITDGAQAILSRLENANNTGYLYDMWAPDIFGGMNPSDGYLVNLLLAPWYVDYIGKDLTAPQWYAVENAGDIWIGQPHDYPTELEDIKLSDGGTVYSLRAANQNGLGWLQSIGFWYDNQNGSQYDVGLWDDWSYTTAMQPWHGYTFTMYEGQKAWIIP